MTTVSEAHAAFRALLEANCPNDYDGNPLPLHWYMANDNPEFPDEPAPFAFTLFDATRSGAIENGRGRGFNRYRNPSSAEVFVFVPKGKGLKPATDLAEAIAGIFRPVNDGVIVVQSATPYPGGPGSELAVPGLPAESGNYFYAGCGVEFYFDLIG